jgi:hypothetical protein
VLTPGAACWLQSLDDVPALAPAPTGEAVVRRRA